ncbi:hypothetical protein ABVF61_25175 [Roseibium sp. HPY-6]|uniref:hypothetical protein n=1 Tax=Roseibium sp. HPY-6 TaxID=3229852 RepID=UPI00338FAFA8
MESSQAYDIALKISDLCAKALQFFIAICSLFGGWVVVKGLPSDIQIRTFIALSFVFSTGAIMGTLLLFIRRADAAIALSRQLYLEGSGEIGPLVMPLFAKNDTLFSRYGAVVGMGVVILSIAILIFLAPDSDDNSKKETRIIPVGIEAKDTRQLGITFGTTGNDASPTSETRRTVGSGRGA